MTKKTLLIAAVASVGFIPLASFAWHGAPCWGAGAPGWHHYDEGPHCMMRGDAPRFGPHHRARAQAPYGLGVRTFGMDRAEAEHFMTEVGSVLKIKSNEQKAWQQMQKAYADLAQTRYDRWKTGEAPQNRQERLQARSAFMSAHAQAFDGYVKARAELQKVFGQEKMHEFDYIVNTGSLLEPPAPRAQPRPPRGPRL